MKRFMKQLLLWGSIFAALVECGNLRLANLPAGEVNASSKGEGVSDIIDTVHVVINVSVMDSNNRPVPDLTRHDFSIAEDDTKQTIDFLARGDSPLKLGLAFDVSEQIIHRLKNQYTMGYYPTNDKYDGSFRYVRVTVAPKDKRKVKVSAPLGYYAPDAASIK